MTNYTALTFYLLAFGCGLVAVVLALLELPVRVRAMRRKTHPRPDRPLLFNAHSDAVKAALANRSVVQTHEEMRGALNALTVALGQEAAARQADDERLARLVAAPDNSWKLFGTVLAVVAATLCGGIGDIVAVLGWHVR